MPAKNNQPKIEIPFSQSEKLFVLFILACVALVWVFTIISYIDLPQTIAAHFDAIGNVDRYDNKVFLFIMPSILVITTALLLVLSRFPHTYNYPGKITESNAERQYRLGRQMMLWISLSMVAVFSIVEYLMVVAAKNPQQGPKMWLVAVIVGLTMLPVLFFIIRMATTK